jgi:outer membrane assembly lipoprotein YfiO
VGPSGIVKDTPAEQLDLAVSLFGQGDIKQAKVEFRKLLRAYKESKEAAEGQYYLGRCEEVEGNFYSAFKEYRKTVHTYPSTARFDEILERQSQIANSFLSGYKHKVFNRVAILPARGKAVEILEAIVEDGPFTEQGELAQYKLGVAHASLGDYEAAVKAFEQVISRYPQSPLVDDARFQIALASLKGTFKPGYDQSSTDLAMQELGAFLREHAESDLALDAQTRLAELQEQRAAHEFGVAEFYESRKRPQAARIYYEAIVSSYAQTSWAPKAVARLQLLDQLPGGASAAASGT